MMDDMDEGNWTFRGVIRFDGLLVWFAHFTLFGFLLDNILVSLGMFKTAYILLFSVLCFVDTGLYCCRCGLFLTVVLVLCLACICSVSFCVLLSGE